MAKIISKHTSGNPAGTIIPCGTSSALPRTLLCDGASYSVSAYPALFAAIGYSFGGSGTSFNVPDFRGRFLRGVDGTASNDPDKASRTAMNAGGNTGNAIGSVQETATEDHKHIIPIYSDNYAIHIAQSGQTPYGEVSIPYAGGSDAYANGRFDFSGTAPALLSSNKTQISSESRPKNAYVNYCIAY